MSFFSNSSNYQVTFHICLKLILLITFKQGVASSDSMLERNLLLTLAKHSVLLAHSASLLNIRQAEEESAFIMQTPLLCCLFLHLMGGTVLQVQAQRWPLTAQQGFSSSLHRSKIVLDVEHMRLLSQWSKKKGLCLPVCGLRKPSTFSVKQEHQKPCFSHWFYMLHATDVWNGKEEEGSQETKR